MGVIRILTLLATGGGEVDHSSRVVNVVDARRDEFPFRDPVLQRPGVGVIEVEVRPPVAFRPEDEGLPLVGQAADGSRCRCSAAPRSGFHLTGRGVGHAHVELVHIAAQTGEVQLAGESLRKKDCCGCADRDAPGAGAVAIDIV